MLYLILQMASLLAVCAAIFFGVGWATRRWMEKSDPWRVPMRRAKSEEDHAAVESLQNNLKQVSDELANRNSEVREHLKRQTQAEGLLKASEETVTQLRSEVSRFQSLYDSQQTRIEELLERIVELETLIDSQNRVSENDRATWQQRVADLEQQLSAALMPLLEAEPTTIAAAPTSVSAPAPKPAPTPVAAPIVDAFDPEEFEEDEDVRLEFEVVPEKRKPISKPTVEIHSKTIPLELLTPLAPISAPSEGKIDESHEILERMERLERQLGEKAATINKKDEAMELELKSRLNSLEDMVLNLRAESEMALLAQLDFQSRSAESESMERRKWEDLENELELRISQLERELSGVKHADMLVSEISDQVEEKLKEQLASLSTEVSEIKGMQHRDEQLMGNLDRLQDSLQKLGIRIEEEHASVPDSVLREMEELTGDILSNVPAAATAMSTLPLATRSPAVDEVAKIRERFEKASESVQELLKEKDETIRALDHKIHEMAKKLDPALVGKDDLQLIKGIGPYIKRTLEKEFGIASFKQIAQLTATEIAVISERLFFKNKIQREEWIAQAIELHEKKYDERLTPTVEF
jgi:predicted flap endonuclease-1-like 5' DNA nuclease